MLALILSAAVAFPATPDCATLHLMRDVDRSVQPTVPFMLRARGPHDGKQLRDAFGTIPNVRTSENFIVKWGRDIDVTETQAKTVLDAFEYAWGKEVDGMKFPAPHGTDDYLFNVYIGDSGSGVPGSLGAAGYSTRDPEGWPMIVLAPTVLWDENYTQDTVAHEFFHAIQDKVGSYGYEAERGAWYFEATAEWVVGEVYPDSPQEGSFLAGYAMLPNLPVDFFDYPDEGRMEEYHQYGAFIFPRYLSDQVADWTLIRDSWTRAGNSMDPLATLDGLLRMEWNSDIATAFGRFASRNAAWDYRRGELYRSNVEWSKGSFPTDYQFVGQVGSEGNAEMVTPPSLSLPQRYGYNVISMTDVQDGAVQVAFNGDDHGSSGSFARYSVHVIVASQSGNTYFELSLDDANDGESEAVSVNRGDHVFLSIASLAQPGIGGRFSGETFGYQYQFSFDDQPASSGSQEQGSEISESAGEASVMTRPASVDATGGCAAVAPVPAATLWMLSLLGVVARRRRPRSN